MHANLLHLISCVFAKLYFLSFIEYYLKFRKTMLLYFVVSFGGVCFNVMVSDEPGIAGSAGVGIISFSLYLEMVLF